MVSASSSTMTKRRRNPAPSTKSGAAVDAAEIRQRAATMLAEVEGGDAVLSLVDALVSERDALTTKCDDLTTKCEALSAEYVRQELRIKQLVHLVYGRKTEKLTKEELAQLAKALGYAKNQRSFTRRCFSDGRFEIDNGATERALRRPCIGRNNYLFTGSPEAAKRLAGAYTLVQSCRAVGVQPTTMRSRHVPTSAATSTSTISNARTRP